MSAFGQNGGGGLGNKESNVCLLVSYTLSGYFKVDLNLNEMCISCLLPHNKTTPKLNVLNNSDLLFLIILILPA